MRNKLQEAFDRIEADSRLKESTREFLRQERNKKVSLFRRPAVRRTLAAACMMLVLALGIGGYSWARTPVSYVSIDINPSIELALNRFDRVVAATPFNQEGEEILKELALKGKTYRAAIDDIMESAALKPYLDGGEELVFTVAAEKGRERQLLLGAEHCSRHAGRWSIGIKADLALVSAAHDNGLSLGKYYAYLELAEYDKTVTPDNCRDMSMSEIHGLISEHRHGGGHHGEAQEPEESGEPPEPEKPEESCGPPEPEKPEESCEPPEPEHRNSGGHHGHGGRH